jgi:hypothetical protein
MYFDRKGYRPAIETELHHFGIANPELQQDYTILALGSWQSLVMGTNYVSALYADHGRAVLGGYETDNCLDSFHRLLLVRK